ncbi:MAG: hypothetical protein OSB25_03345 [Salibacteraceae bacterium]|nr:hypothetical protein [Salibacteraceae bacterium]|tara:strand:+ start:26405 stop:26794 length:390 start_codon:yes stop_codon:yes gene_type:complete
MKKTLKISLLIICVSALSSCKKKETENTNNEINVTSKITDVTIKNTDDYELDLMISGEEEGASITTQAQNMEKSELVRDSTTNWSVVYYYTPVTNFLGSDYVEIETCTGGTSMGCSDIEIVRINFTVIN